MRYLDTLLLKLGSLIRRVYSPIVYYILRFTVYRGKLPDIWDDVKGLDPQEFSNVLNRVPYLWDPLKGLVDFSPQQYNFFWLPRKSGRDCDNWARMWFWYWRYHKKDVYEMIIKDPGFTTRIHMVTVANFNNQWHMCDYRYLGGHDTLNGALNANITKFVDPVYVIHRKYINSR